MPFTATVLTMFPEAFPGPLGVSLIGTAWREKGLWSLETVDIRAFSTDTRGFLDDTPAGGGPGAVLKADVVARWPGLLVEYYGMTEGGGTCILMAHEHPDKLHTVGQPAPGHDIRLIDDDGNVSVPGTEQFLRDYMEAFHQHMARVLTVLPRDA